MTLPHQPALIDRLEAVIDDYFEDVRQELYSGSLCVMTDAGKPTELAIVFIPTAPYDLFDAMGIEGAPDIKRPLYEALKEARANGDFVPFIDELIAVFDRWRDPSTGSG